MTSELLGGPAKAYMKRLATFVAGHGATQVIQTASGLLLLRWLTVEEYAQYGLAMAFLGTFRVFVEMGLPLALVALVGTRSAEPSHVGRYLAAAKTLRMRLFLIFSGVCLAAFIITTRRQHWQWVTVLSLATALLSCLWLEGKTNIDSRVLFVRGEVRSFYIVQTKAGLARLMSIVAVHVATVLNGALALWISALTTWMSARLIQRRSRALVDEPKRPDEGAVREVTAFISPLVPSIAFFALQGQITVMIMGLIGKTQEIAEVAALGRLAQLFALLGASNMVLTGPIIAAAQSATLRRTYGIVVGSACVAAASLVVVCALQPRPLLFILGENYDHLSVEASWTVIGASLRYLAALCSVINRSRHWISWRITFLTMAVELVVQIGAIFYFDLSTTLDAVYFTVATAGAALAAQLCVNIAGLARVRTENT
jgi:O-antigen/teichoic acid export membrane protein